MKIFLFAFSFFFSTLVFAQSNESKLTPPTHKKKFNYSFSLAIGLIRIDEKYSWDSVRKINAGIGVKINYKNLFTQEIEYRLNKPELLNLNASFPFLYNWNRKGKGFNPFDGIYKLSYEFFYWHTIGIKVEKEAINQEILANSWHILIPSKMYYLNRKVLLCYKYKLKEYELFLRTGISLTQYTQFYTVAFYYYPNFNEQVILGNGYNKTGFVLAPEFRFPIAKRFQAKAGIEWMIFPTKIPNLFEANVGIIYNMKRIKDKVKS
ncbi:MAG: hypothetical protein RL708_2318 [Bacteroidota bacterium]|jgi:hypothetical protein